MLRMLRQDNIVELKEAFRRKGKLVCVQHRMSWLLQHRHVDCSNCKPLDYGTSSPKQHTTAHAVQPILTYPTSLATAVPGV